VVDVGLLGLQVRVSRRVNCQCGPFRTPVELDSERRPGDGPS